MFKIGNRFMENSFKKKSVGGIRTHSLCWLRHPNALGHSAFVLSTRRWEGHSLVSHSKWSQRFQMSLKMERRRNLNRRQSSFLADVFVAGSTHRRLRHPPS